jgi:ABC-type bacteriocin/lantibiotic exporter with double-glycine peptidase domain
MRNMFPSELLWLFERIRPLFAWHLASFFCLTVGSALALINPLALMWVIDRVLPNRDIPLLICAVTVIFVSSELRAILSSSGVYLTLLASQRTVVSIRMELLKRLNSLSAEYHENTPVGARLYTLREPIEEVAYFGSDLVPAVLRTALVTTFTLSAMLFLNPRLTLLVLPAIPAFVLARRHFRGLLAERSDKVHVARAELSAFLEEHMSSVLQIQLLQQEKRQERRAFRLFANVVRSQVKLASGGVQFASWTNLPIAAAVAIIIGFGAWTALRGLLTVGGLVAFYSYVFQLFDPLSSVLETYARAQRTFSSIRRIQTILALRPTVTDRNCGPEMPRSIACNIRFTGVFFGYERQKGFLTVPSLSIESGAHVAIVGENGAGKSTFAKLAARLYDPDRGSIIIGESHVRNIPLKQFRSLVCYVPSIPVLFDETLAENLRLGNPLVGVRQLDAIIDVMEMRPFIAALPHGLLEPLGPAGCQLSGGQRQRLALARALLRRPRILILDEATSALDPPAELSVLRKIPEFLPGVTIIFISHRLGNVEWMDRILVFHHGRIVEDGHHHELRVSGSFYAKLQRASHAADFHSLS